MPDSGRVSDPGRISIREPQPDGSRESPERIQRKIHELVQEVRVVIPGTQALLGFQFVVFFSGGYSHLEPPQRYLHLANLIAVVLATGFLMAPVTLHQLREEGHDSPTVLRMTRRLLLIGMGFLLVGLSGDTYVASDITMHDDAVSAGIASAAMVFLVGLWFVRHVSVRHRNRD